MKHGYLLIIPFFILSCENEHNGKLFTMLPPGRTNITFTNQLRETDEFNIIEYLYFNNGAGVAAGDINNDGLTDLYFSSNQGKNRLYLNLGNFRFRDITEAAGFSGEGNWKTGVTMADVNGDGWLDIYACEVGNYKSFNGRNRLYINNRDLTFTEKAREYNLDFSGFSTQAAFLDFDLDGDLDMYLLNHSVHKAGSYGKATLRFQTDSLAGDILFRNDVADGKRAFTDVSSKAGIYRSQIGYGLGISVSDFNDDGFPDIYISNDFHENDYLYYNNGDGTFSEKLTQYIQHTSRSSMGNDAADFNNDGLTDIIVLDMLPEKEKVRKAAGGEDDLELAVFKKELGYNDQFVRNTLQLNTGDGYFSETGILSGVYATDWSWSPLFLDADNDGWKDLFITSGIYRRANDLDYVRFLTAGNEPVSEKTRSLSDRELYEKMPLSKNLNHIFRNNSDLTFTEKAIDWGFEKPSYSNGSSYADLDNDGDYDLIVNNINEKAFIYRNNSEKITGNHYLNFSLKGKDLNTGAIGTKVTICLNGQKQVCEQFFSRGFMSSSTAPLHFGTGSETNVDSVIVRWPDRSIQIIKDIPCNQTLYLSQDDDKKTKFFLATPRTLKVFSDTMLKGLDFSHREDPFTDLAREPLIPFSLAAEGPAVAVGDLNNDGMDDVFAGGAKDQAAVIFFQMKDGSFMKMCLPVKTEDNFTDDADASIFDADGDKDNDIWIVHGGNEYPLNNPFLTDNLLLNDGHGNFTRAGMQHFSHNGSCVCTGDMDNDGDQDVFSGSRSVPGAYGLSPISYLLENDGAGHFNISGKLRVSGMVTDALWTDYDNDGDNDLAVAGDWMKVNLFRNDKGNFEEVTDQSGLENTEGWWNCVYSFDYDNDGDMDLFCGNTGMNSVLKASEKEPAELYINDFDNNGIPDPIICSYVEGTSYPFASFDELKIQLPFLSQKFRTYSGFAGMTAREIFGSEIMGKSLHKKVQLTESCLFINNNGFFTIKKLPVAAQFSPVRSMVYGDFNCDGRTDIIIAGNSYKARQSYGRLDAGFGLFLPGDREKGFRPLMPWESGLRITGDARRMAILNVHGEKYIVAGINNGSLQVISVNHPPSGN